MDFVQGSNGCLWSVLLFIPRIHIHEPNDFDAFSRRFWSLPDFRCRNEGRFSTQGERERAS